MIEYQQYKRIAGLIAGDVGDILASSEKSELTDWLNEKPENRQLYQLLRNSSRFQGWRDIINNSDTKEGWDRLYRAIQEERRQKLRFNILKFAAAIILPLMIAGGVYFFVLQPDSKKEFASRTAEIKPGGTQAVLILNDGQSVILDTPDDLLMKEKDGTTIQKSKGRLNYTSQTEKLTSETLYNTIEIPRGGEYNLVLSDGTRIFFNSLSRIKYPVKFSTESRRVELTGEAYFEVAHSTDQPFIVKIADLEIEVLGTSFNINAYESSGTIVTTLVEGQVKVRSLNNQGVSRILQPYEQAVFNAGKCSIEVKKVDVSLFTAWKNGEFVFQNERLEDIMVILTRWYSAEVFFMNPSVKELLFSGSISRYGEIEPILEIIQSTGKVKIEINRNTIILKEV